MMVTVRSIFANGYSEAAEIHEWHTARGLLAPEVKHLDSGYVRISFGGQSFSQFPDSFRGILPDEYIFNAAWNRDEYQRFEIVEV